MKNGRAIVLTRKLHGQTMTNDIMITIPLFAEGFMASYNASGSSDFDKIFKISFLYIKDEPFIFALV